MRFPEPSRQPASGPARRRSLAAAVLLAPWIAMTMMLGSPALAHKPMAAVWIEGDAIGGEIGFAAGNMAPAGTKVEVYGPDGEMLAEVATDAHGRFRFVPSQSVAHRFHAKLGGGHIAEATLTQDELPVGLIEDTAAAAPDRTRASATAAGATLEPLSVTSRAELQAMIAETLQQEIRPLRKELAAYREKADLQSILGGIGYIFGVFGLGFFIAGKYRNRAR